MNIPSLQECENIWELYSVPDTVRAHSKAVCKLATGIANIIKNNGVDLNVDVVDRASLLHDIFRSKSFNDRKSFLESLSEERQKFLEQKFDQYHGITHGVAAYHELKDKYPEVASVVGAHSDIIQNVKNYSIEQLIVNYSDKRVTHDQYVTIDERFDDGAKRWGCDDAKLIEAAKNSAKQTEAYLFKLMGDTYNPGDLDPILNYGETE